MRLTRLTDEIMDAIEKAIDFCESEGKDFEAEESIPKVRDWVEAVRTQRGIEKQANTLRPRLRAKR